MAGRSAHMQDATQKEGITDAGLFESLRRPLVLLIKGEIELQHHVQGSTGEGQ